MTHQEFKNELKRNDSNPFETIQTQTICLATFLVHEYFKNYGQSSFCKSQLVTHISCVLLFLAYVRSDPIEAIHIKDGADGFHGTNHQNDYIYIYVTPKGKVYTSFVKNLRLIYSFFGASFSTKPK